MFFSLPKSVGVAMGPSNSQSVSLSPKRVPIERKRVREARPTRRVYGSITLNNTQIRTLRAPGTVLPAGTDMYMYTSTMNALVELDQQQPPLSASAAAK